MVWAPLPVAHAQLGEYQAPALSEAERARLKAIVDTPVDKSATYVRQAEAYVRKTAAARMLGDQDTLVRLLREWSKFDDAGKRNLRSVLSGTDLHEEALQVGEELVASERQSFRMVWLRASIARDYLIVGRTSQAKAHLDAAETLLKTDIARAGTSGENAYHVRRLQAIFHQSKSVFLRQTGRWAEGIEEAKLAVERAQQMYGARMVIRDENARADALYYLMVSYVDLSRQQTDAGLYADAEWNLRQAYLAARKENIPESLMWVLYRFIAEYYAAAGQFKDSRIFLDRSVVLSEGMGHTLASVQRRALETIRMTALVSERRWDEAARVAQTLDAAIAAAKQPPTVTQLESRLRAQIALHTGAPGKALEILRPALTQDERLLGPEHYFVALDRGLMAGALAATGDAAGAKLLYAQALRGLTSPAALTGDFTENAFQRFTRRSILQGYMQLLARTARDNPQDAVALFEVADQLTASSVQQALSEAAVRSAISTPGLAEIIRKEQDAKNEVAVLTAQITGAGGPESRQQNAQAIERMRVRIRELEAVRRGYKAQIQKDFPDYFQLVQPRAPTPAEIAKQLRPGELFLAVVPLPDTTYAWAIDAQGGVRFHDAGLGEAQLAQWVGQVRRTLDIGGFEGGRIPAFAFGDAHRIYQALFAPFDEQITGKQQVIVSTGGVLAQLPFAVLPRKAHAGGLGDAPWLLRDVAVSHVPSAAGWLALKRLQQVPAAPQPLLAWGDPLFDIQAKPEAAAAPAPVAGDSTVAAANPVVRKVVPTRSVETGAQRNVMDPETYVVYSRIPPLPETRDEVQALARILGADPAQDLVLGDKATRQSVIDASKSGQLGKKRVVVFATHGLLAGDLPDLNQPALAMAATGGDAKTSPLLTLEDVLGLKLNADWVVLSACNTAGADGRAQEALSGLARGFFYAGSRSLLVTHWSVESRSAMLLTTTTFEAYRRDPRITRAQALRQAMLEVMTQADYVHPAFWAPYALVGEGGR